MLNMEDSKSDQIALDQINGRLMLLFDGESTSVKRWLESPKLAFGGKSPMEIIDTAEGTILVQDLNGRIVYGVYS